MSLSTPLEVGAVLDDRYRLERILGEGGFGIVFEGTQTSTGQRVAVKVMHARLLEGSLGDQALERFEREMQVIALLRHPNIVKLVDSGTLPDGTVYLVLEFVEGEELSAVLRREDRLGLSEACRLLGQVLEALVVAHEQGVVHRDLKPDNIMVTRAGSRRNALVLDFGIAGVSGTSAEQLQKKLTVTGQFIGTPNYMAPEQFSGEPPTPQSDIYSWGLVMIEALTGRVPVDAESLPALIMKHMADDPVPIPDHIAQGPLGPVLRKATAKKLEDRYPTAQAALDALDGVGVSISHSMEKLASVDTAMGDTADISDAVSEASASRDTGTGGVVERIQTASNSTDVVAAPEAGSPESPAAPGRSLVPIIAVLVVLIVAGVVAIVLILGGDGSGSEDTDTEEDEGTAASAQGTDRTAATNEADVVAATSPPATADTPPEPEDPDVAEPAALADGPELVELPSEGVRIGMSEDERESLKASLPDRAFDLDAPGLSTFPESVFQRPAVAVMRTEVTAADWRALANTAVIDTICPDALAEPSTRDAAPMVAVGAAEAAAFCAAIDMRLPTAREWEAIASGAGKHLYGFGRELDESTRTVLGSQVAVAEFDWNVTVEGVFDMSGSVAEWVTCEPDHEVDYCEGGYAVRGGAARGEYAGPFWWRSDVVGFVPAQTTYRCNRRPDVGFRCLQEIE